MNHTGFVMGDSGQAIVFDSDVVDRLLLRSIRRQAVG